MPEAIPDPSGDRVSPPPSSRTAVGQADEDNRPPVLIVLSDEQEEWAVAACFEDEGWAVHYADDLAALLQKIMAGLPSLIVTDDLRVLRTIRNECRDGLGHFVAMLVDDRERAKSTAMDAGANVTFARPIDPFDIIRWWIGRGGL